MKKLKISFEEESKQEKNKRKYKKYPRIDVNAIMFGNEEDIETENVEYIRKIKAKVLRRFLLPTVIVSILLITVISSASIYIYTNQTTKIERLTLAVSNLRETLDKKKKSRVDEIKQQFIQNSNTTDTQQNITTEQVMQALQEDSSYSSNNNNSNSNVIPDKRKCSFPDCNSNANTGSYYCGRHECSKSGCHEPKANDLCLYCEKHKCDMPGCNSAKALNSYYCYIHP